MMNMRPMDRGYTICGPAVTVRYLPVDPMNPTSEESELMSNHATMIVNIMNALKTGDVLRAGEFNNSRRYLGEPYSIIVRKK